VGFVPFVIDREKETMSKEQGNSYKGNIMIVDDTLPNLRVLAKMLTQYGYLVRGIPNGAMALTAATSEPPDLILLDIMMPEMDGYEVCRQLKENDRTQDIPVIFISALDEVLDKVKAFAVGGVDYIPKPFQAEEVLARVATHLALQSLRRQLERQVIALQQANAELDAFAHTVAHDLKGPISNAVGFAELLKDMHTTMSEEELDEYLGTIAQVGCKMQSIIDALLLLAGVRKMEELTTGPLDMAQIVDDVQRRMAYMIEEYQADIIMPETWPVAVGYGPWVEEVWTNYLSNALKYGGNPPSVELGYSIGDCRSFGSAQDRLEIADRGSQNAESLSGKGDDLHQEEGKPEISDLRSNSIHFWVRDNGCGLTSQEQARLFTPFTRLGQLRVQGHGLGLSIVRRIVEKLGGQVGVESEVGQGSVFFFTLPMV
jgi:two-component system sensor histidine kinase/response regulator